MDKVNHTATSKGYLQKYFYNKKANMAMGANDFSLVAYINLATLPSAGTVYAIFGTTNNNAMGLNVTETGALLLYKSGVGNASGGVVPTGQWVKVAVVFDSTATTNNVTFYINDTATVEPLNVDFEGITDTIGNRFFTTINII